MVLELHILVLELHILVRELQFSCLAGIVHLGPLQASAYGPNVTPSTKKGTKKETSLIILSRHDSWPHDGNTGTMLSPKLSPRLKFAGGPLLYQVCFAILYIRARSVNYSLLYGKPTLPWKPLISNNPQPQYSTEHNSTLPEGCRPSKVIYIYIYQCNLFVLYSRPLL